MTLRVQKWAGLPSLHVRSKILTELREKNQKSQPSVVGNAQTSDEEGNQRRQLG